MTYTFNASYQLSDEIDPDFLCVKVANPDFEVDEVPSNDELCISELKEFTVIDPYPNPTTDLITIAFVLPASGEVDIYLYDDIGKLVGVIYNGTASKGLNQIKLSTFSISHGTYYYRVRYNERSATKAFIKY